MRRVVARVRFEKMAARYVLRGVRLTPSERSRRIERTHRFGAIVDNPMKGE
jgi:hypothetical protein